ncbi:hypothetical protein CsSME_00006026 [Camellia sinensis var. sinensis]
MVGDRPLLAGESVLDNVEVDIALSTAVLLPADLNRMAELIEYENFSLMMRHCILGHSFVVKAEEFKKKLTKKTKEAAKLLTSLSQFEARIRNLLDQAKTAQLAQNKVEDRAEAAENIVEVTKAEAKEAKEKEA